MSLHLATLLPVRHRKTWTGRRVTIHDQLVAKGKVSDLCDSTRRHGVTMRDFCEDPGATCNLHIDAQLDMMSVTVSGQRVHSAFRSHSITADA